MANNIETIKLTDGEGTQLYPETSIESLTSTTGGGGNFLEINTVNGHIVVEESQYNAQSFANANEKIPSGGTTGQVLTKRSNSNNDVEWVTPESVGTTNYLQLTNKPSINSVTLNGNNDASNLGLATAEQGAKADTAVQSVSVDPTTVTGAPGTDAAVTNTGTSTEPVLKFTIPQGNDGHNPNIGTYVTSDNGTSYTPNLPGEPSIKSDFIVVLDKSNPNSVTSTIWTWDDTLSTPAWASTGRDANMAYFGSGELVSGVNIVDNTDSVVSTDVLSAKQGNELDKKIAELTEHEILAKKVLQCIIHPTQRVWKYAKDAYMHFEVPVIPNHFYRIYGRDDNNNTSYTFLTKGVKCNQSTDGTTPLFASGYNGTVGVIPRTSVIVQAPSDAHVLYLLKSVSLNSNDYVAKKVTYLEKNYVDIRKEEFFVDADITQQVLEYPLKGAAIAFTGEPVWSQSIEFDSVVMPVGNIVSLHIENVDSYSRIAFLSSDTVNPQQAEQANIAGKMNLTTGTTRGSGEFLVPEGANYIYIMMYSNYDSPGYEGDNKLKAPLKILATSRKGGTRRPIERISNTSYFQIMPEYINYFEIDINPTTLSNNWGESQTTNQDNSPLVKAGAAIKLPSTYSQNGKPTRVVLVCGGGQTCTTENQMLAQTYSDLINMFLDAGYAVLTVNGYTVGEYNGTTNFGTAAWGCPRGVEAIKKSIEYIRSRYNVYDEIMIHGVSAGGPTAYAYTMNYPEDVLCVALMEPTSSTNNAGQIDGDSARRNIAMRFGYANTGEGAWFNAVTDNFSNFVGYSLPLSFVKYTGGVPQNLMNDDLSQNLIDQSTEFIVGHFPRPLRIWHGTSTNDGAGDPTFTDTVNINLNKNIVTALRNGGSNASIRVVNGRKHGQFVAPLSASDYVFLEEMAYLHRFE